MRIVSDSLVNVNNNFRLLNFFFTGGGAKYRGGPELPGYAPPLFGDNPQ